MATIELNDDTLYTSALPAGARVFGATSAAASEPTSFGREAFYNYISAALSPVASSGSATDLTSGTLPLGRLHGRLQDIANVPTWSQGDVIYFDGSNLTRLGPGTSGQFLKTQGAGANPVWATPSGGGGGGGDLLSTNNLSDVSSAATARTNLGLAIGTNVQAWDAQLDSLSSASANGVSLVVAADYAAMKALLDLEIGTDVQAYDADLAQIAALTTTSFGRSLLTVSDAAALRSAAGVRERLGANLTLYVRTDGSDSNTGLANTPGGAFLTLQKAIDTVAAIDLGSYAVTIQMGSGTYAAGVNLKSYVGAGPVTILGDATTPSNVLISSSGPCIAADGIIGSWGISGLKLVSSASHGIVAVNGSVLQISGAVEFGACGAYHVALTTGSKLTIASVNYSITGGALGHWYVITGAQIVASSCTVTVTGTPTFSTFAEFSNLSGLSSGALAFSGSATGVRYGVTLNAVLNTGGGGANFFPGNSAGTAATGGQYA